MILQGAHSIRRSRKEGIKPVRPLQSVYRGALRAGYLRTRNESVLRLSDLQRCGGIVWHRWQQVAGTQPCVRPQPGTSL